MLGGLLDDAFTQEMFAYEEIARRFCKENSTDDDVKEFQHKCRNRQIPRQFLNADEWTLEIERPLGNGNPGIAQGQAQALMAILPNFSPMAQQEVLHEYVEVMTDNPRKANRLAPVNENGGVTNAQERAEFLFGTLMQGVPARLKDGVNEIEQIETLLGLMAGVVARIEQNGNMATSGEVAGLQSVMQYIDQLIQQLSKNPAERERTNQYAGQLSKLGNSVKGFAQRIAEQQSAAHESLSLNYKDAPPSIQRQMEAKAGFQPATDAEAQVTPQTAKALHGLAVKQAKETQSATHKQLGFDAEQARLDQAAVAEQARKNMMADAEIEKKRKETAQTQETV